MSGLLFGAAGLVLLAGFVAGWAGGYHAGTARGRYLATRDRPSGQFVVLASVPPGATEVVVVDAPPRRAIDGGGE